MTIEQKILSKLEPHAKRIKDGEGNDFDYLPAVLLHLINVQKLQAMSLESIKSTALGVELQSKEQITKFESATQSKMEQANTAIGELQIQLQKSQAITGEQLGILAIAHSAHANQTNEHLRKIDLQLESLVSNTQRSHIKVMRLLIAGLIAFVAMIGLAVVILQRH